MEFIWIICSLIVGIFTWGVIIVTAITLTILANGGVTKYKYLQKIFDTLLFVDDIKEVKEMEIEIETL